MRAAVLQAFGSKLAVTDIAPPAPGPDEVLVRVRAAGICGTDLKAWNGLLPGITLPRVLGHEIAGEVVADADIAAGTRVACYIYGTCGRCTSCASGRETLCRLAVRLGLERDGGFAEFVVVPRRQLLPFAPHVPFAHAALAMDAVATTWSALKGAGGLRMGHRLIIVGAGGLGLSAVQIGRSLGASVAVVDIDEPKLCAAERAGADRVALPAGLESIRDWTGDGADVVLEASGTADGFRIATSGVCPGGTIVCCGYRPGDHFSINSSTLVLGGLTVRGSRAASLTHAREALRAVECGDVVPHVDRHVPLQDVTAALAQLNDGGVIGRIVVDV